MSTLPPLLAACVTQPGREGLLCRAICNFAAQQYAGPRKLHIYVTDVSHLLATKALVDALQPWLVRSQTGGTPCEIGVVDPEPAFPGDDYSRQMWWRLLGAARHAKMFGADHGDAEGGLLAVWDDDDQHHPLRLTRQVAAVKPSVPSFLSAGIWHYFDSAEIFICDLERRHENLVERVLPSTMVVRAADALKAFQYRGHITDAKSDDQIYTRPKGTLKGSPTAALARLLLSTKGFDATRCCGEWWWTVMGVRGDNAQGYEWHRRWAVHETKGRSIAWLRESRVLLQHWLDEYRWDGPAQIDVCGRDGMAFPYTPRAGWPNTFPPIGDPVGIERIQENHDEREGEDAKEATHASTATEGAEAGNRTATDRPAVAD